MTNHTQSAPAPRSWLYHAVQSLKTRLSHVLGLDRPNTQRSSKDHGDKRHDAVEKASEDSFPASDPPAWN